VFGCAAGWDEAVWDVPAGVLAFWASIEGAEMHDSPAKIRAIASHAGCRREFFKRVIEAIRRSDWPGRIQTRPGAQVRRTNPAPGCSR
jgi:hypothetical protein